MFVCLKNGCFSATKFDVDFPTRPYIKKARKIPIKLLEFLDFLKCT